MKRIFFSLAMVVMLALAACASLTNTSPTQLSPSDQVATIVAATMQAFPTNPPATSTPEPPAELLPNTLYYLSNDGIYRRDDVSLILQVYRMERDGKTSTRLTDEPNGVDGYDVSLVDGTVAFIVDNQLILVNADGSNRRVLVDGGSTRVESNPRFFKEPLSSPVFFPDGRTIAYGHRPKGLYFYDVLSGVSTLVIEDQWTDPLPNGMRQPIETYSPVSYFPNGSKLLLALGQWEAPPVYAVYYLETGKIIRPSTGDRDLCCGGPIWSLDGSNYYGTALIPQYLYRTGEIWQVDAETGKVKVLIPFDFNNETMNFPQTPYLAPDGRLYYFFGSYRVNSGYYEAPVLQLVRSAPDGVLDRTVLRDENFVLMSEALWAPDASFVIVATAPSRYWLDSEIGVLELYYTDGQKSLVWLAPVGREMKWGP